MHNVNLLPKRRTITVSMGTDLLVRKVTSVETEVDARFDVAWKVLAVAQKSLPMMVGEDLVAGNYDAGPAGGGQNVDVALCARPKAARAEWKRIFAEEAPTSGDMVVKLARKHQAHLTVLDPSWSVEHDILENLAGDASEARMATQMLKHFPSATQERSEEQTLLLLNGMKSSDQYKFASRTSHVKHGFVIKAIAKLVDGEAPSLEQYSEDKTMQTIIPRLQYFCRHREPSGSGGATPPIVGAKALVRFLELAQAKLTNGEEVTNDDVAKLKAYSHLIPEDRRGEVANVTEAAHKPVDLGKRTGTVKKADKAMEEAMAMFGM